MTQADQIVHLLFQVDKAIHEQLRDADAKCPLSLPELMVLSYIDRVEAASVSDLAKQLGIRKASVSVKVAGLERRKLVTRDSCLFDKRSHSIRLTPKARSLLEQTQQYVATHTAPIFNILTSDEKDNFIQLLTKISNQ
jgi:DNA-binding MarR family transcriptional regulator